MDPALRGMREYSRTLPDVSSRRSIDILHRDFSTVANAFTLHCRSNQLDKDDGGRKDVVCLTRCSSGKLLEYAKAIRQEAVVLSALPAVPCTCELNEDRTSDAADATTTRCRAQLVPSLLRWSALLCLALGLEQSDLDVVASSLSSCRALYRAEKRCNASTSEMEYNLGRWYSQQQSGDAACCDSAIVSDEASVEYLLLIYSAFFDGDRLTLELQQSDGAARDKNVPAVVVQQAEILAAWIQSGDEHIALRWFFVFPLSCLDTVAVKLVRLGISRQTFPAACAQFAAAVRPAEPQNFVGDVAFALYHTRK